MSANPKNALKILWPLIIAIAAFLALHSFEPQQRMVGAVFAATVTLWITEILPLAMTALLSTCLLIIFAGVKEKEVFAAYGDPAIPLFIGSFILAKAMELSGLSERFAYTVLSQRWATKSPSRLLFWLGAIACAISLFVSNTATTAMLLPVGLSMLHSLHADHKGSSFAVAIMLMLTWGSSIAVGVPVGTPPNLIAIDLIEKSTGTRIGFLEWATFGMPITILMTIGAWAVLWFLYRKDAPTTAAATETARLDIKQLGPVSNAERNTLVGFIVAIALWILPDLSVAILGPGSAFAKGFQGAFPPSVASLVGAALLFILPIRDDSKPFTWREATTIEWGTILLFAGGIALGQAMFSTGLAKELGTLAAQASGAHSLWTITALCTAVAIILSELASNTASATTLVPVAIGLAQGAHVSPIAPALGVALGASLGFMLPVSTAPNAIVYSSGLVPAKQMMKAGLLIDIIGFAVTLIGLRIMLPLMGLT